MDDERTARAPGDPGPELRQRAEAQLRQRPGASADRVPADAAVERVLHELEVHQIELEMQNEELRRTQAALEMSRAKYFDLYDLAPVGYLTLSDTGLILEANLTAATLLGVDRGALRRQPLTRFLVPEDQDRYYVCRKRLLARGQPQTCELRMVRQDGSSLWVGLNATVGPGGDDAEPVCRVTLSDITPIAQNYQNSTNGGYNVYHSTVVADYPATNNAPDQPALLLANVPFANATGNPVTDRKSFAYVVAAPVAGDNYWVRPVDNTGNVDLTGISLSGYSLFKGDKG